MTALLATAFTAGLVATVNPCGFAMLPAYLGYYLGLGEHGIDRRTALRRSVVVGMVVSAGFLVVFGVTGAIIVAGLRSLASFIPWVALAVGAGLIVLGLALLRGRALYLRLPGVAGARQQREHRAVFMFGVAYAVASLSCTLPIFLSLVAGTFTQSSFLGGLAAFLAYGAGMSVVLMAITIAMAVGRDSLVSRLRRASRHVGRISGVVLLLAGGFIVWYWASLLAGGPATGGNAVRLVDEVSSAITTIVASHPVATIGVLGTLIAAAAFLATRRTADEPVG